MKFNEVATVATRAFYKVGFELKKHSPEILVVAGVIGTVASAVMACKASTKVNFVLEETKDKVEIIHTGAEQGEVKGYLENGEVGMVPYNAEDAQKDLALVYAQTGLKLAKMYAPAILLGAASITSILVGHNVLHKRNLALAAAYTAVDTGFKQYRGRVLERFGDKMDKELLYNIKAKQIEETVVNEDGTESTVTKTVDVADRSALLLSPYTFCFDETANGWVRDAERNKYFLSRQEQYANDLLQAKRVVFLNEVLDMVGIDRVPMGQRIGWSLDDPNSDGYISFGVLEIHSEANRNFVNGLEKSVWLEFNVDGYVDKYLISPAK